MFFIYRLTDEVHDYYGQTENPKRRMDGHKDSTENSRSKLLDKSKMKMHIIHRLYTQEEADETEEFYQLNFDCVNNSVTGRTESEWRLANKEQLSAKQAEHYQRNKEKILKNVMEYRKKNISSIREKDAERGRISREKNKERNTKKYECECGGKYTHTNKSAHVKSKKHQDYINQK